MCIRDSLYVAYDQKYVDEEGFGAMYHQTEVVKKCLNGFIRYLKKPGFVNE